MWGKANLGFRFLTQTSLPCGKEAVSLCWTLCERARKSPKATLTSRANWRWTTTTKTWRTLAQLTVAKSLTHHVLLCWIGTKFPLSLTRRFSPVAYTTLANPRSSAWLDLHRAAEESRRWLVNGSVTHTETHTVCRLTHTRKIYLLSASLSA